jgi:Sec-independent protein translocase protein TatA
VFGIDFEELFLLAVLAFILFGPQKLPEYAAKFGRLVAKLREASSDLSRQCQSSFPDLLQPPAQAGGSQPPTPWKPPTLATRPCPGCSREVGADFAFCPHCGRRLLEEAVSPSEPLISREG